MEQHIRSIRAPQVQITGCKVAKATTKAKQNREIEFENAIKKDCQTHTRIKYSNDSGDLFIKGQEKEDDTQSLQDLESQTHL